MQNGKTKSINIVLYCLIFAVPLFLTFFGFDLEDSGTHLYNAITMFDPQSDVGSQTFLSNLIIYIWYRIFGRFGLISTFILNTFSYVLVGIVTVHFLSDIIPKTIALVGTFFSVLMQMKFIHSSSYNTFTVVFLLICCVFFYYGF